jgi:hypothetical protein
MAGDTYLQTAIRKNSFAGDKPRGQCILQRGPNKFFWTAIGVKQAVFTSPRAHCKVKAEPETRT